MPGRISRRSARKTVDGRMKGHIVCAHLRNKFPEYSWKVDLRTLHDIEQLIVNVKLLGKYMLLRV